MTMLAPDAVVLGEIDGEATSADERFWSVTTLLKPGSDPEGLLYWSAEKAAAKACSQAAYLSARIEAEGLDVVVKDLRDARFDKAPVGQRSETELGTAVHDLCEEYGITGIKPVGDAETQPFIDQFDRWAQKAQPKFHAVEMPVYNRRFGYAGTLDFIVELQGMLLIGDYKTSRKSVDNYGKTRKPYPEVALQLAAYRHAEFAATWRMRRYEYYRRRYYLLGAEELPMAVPMPAVEGGMVIHLTPEHCDPYPVQCDEEIFKYFLHCIEVSRFRNEVGKKVIGPKLEFGGQ